MKIYNIFLKLKKLGVALIFFYILLQNTIAIYGYDLNYIGCFKDKGDPFGTQNRDLDGLMVDKIDMTVEDCINLCSSKGFKYAGVEYGTQCFCGNSYGKYATANNCNMKCSGNLNEICGGFWANSVYKTSDLGRTQLDSQNKDVEFGTDRRGEDYKNFILEYADYRLCKSACEREKECKAWTYVKPNTFQGPKARCWLKNAIPRPSKNNACISGVKKAIKSRNTNSYRKGNLFIRPKIDGYRLDWCREWAIDCGKGAADAFCKRFGYTGAKSWEIDSDIGLTIPTKIITSGKICNQDFCDGFKFIKCKIYEEKKNYNNPNQESNNINNGNRKYITLWGEQKEGKAPLDNARIYGNEIYLNRPAKVINWDLQEARSGISDLNNYTNATRVFAIFKKGRYGYKGSPILEGGVNYPNIIGKVIPVGTYRVIPYAGYRVTIKLQKIGFSNRNNYNHNNYNRNNNIHKKRAKMILLWGEQKKGTGPLDNAKVYGNRVILTKPMRIVKIEKYGDGEEYCIYEDNSPYSPIACGNSKSSLRDYLLQQGTYSVIVEPGSWDTKIMLYLKPL